MATITTNVHNVVSITTEQRHFTSTHSEPQFWATEVTLHLADGSNVSFTAFSADALALPGIAAPLPQPEVTESDFGALDTAEHEARTDALALEMAA